MNPLPTIVVISYQREHSLRRLLQSLSNAWYPSPDVRLIISVDHSNNHAVAETANRFQWGFGEKIVIQHPKRLGLKRHVLWCGDLSQKYEAVILLEDDLYVSPYFYSYALQSSEYYRNDSRVAGISLYTHSFNEVAVVPFYPIHDGSDVFFLQVVSSWGASFWKYRWNEFRQWMDSTDCTTRLDIPETFLKWPESSWKKYFIAYLVATNRYFVYPRISLTTNYSDPGGEHIRKGTSLHQVQILQGEKRWMFRAFDESMIKYDAYCEIKPDYLRLTCPFLVQYEFAVDLYGNKPLGTDHCSHLITSKKTKHPICTFGLNFKAIHANIVSLNEGEFFSLTEVSHCYDTLWSRALRKAEFFDFFYRKTSVVMYLLLIIKRIFSR